MKITVSSFNIIAKLSIMIIIIGKEYESSKMLMFEEGGRLYKLNAVYDYYFS